MIEDIAASRRLRIEADRRQPTPSFLLVSTLDMAAWSSSRWTERHCGRAALWLLAPSRRHPLPLLVLGCRSRMAASAAEAVHPSDIALGARLMCPFLRCPSNPG